MTNASHARVQAFVDAFIRSEYVQGFTADRDGDYVNEPDRASRVWTAAEFGADGKTHAEVIGDWRDAFDCLLHDRRAWSAPERFAAAVHAHFDAVEARHQTAGTLHQEIG